MSPSRRHLRTALRAAISLGLLALLVRSGVDPGAVAGRLGEAFGRPVELGAAFLLYAVAGSLVRGMRWKALVVPLGYPIRLARSTELFLIGTFFNQILPSGMGGDVVKTLMVAKDRGSEGLGRARAASSVVVDRALGLLPLLAVGLAAALVAGDRVGSEVTTALVVIGVAGVAALGLLIRADAWRGIAARLPGAGWLLARPPIARFLDSFGDYGPRALAQAFGWGLAFTLLLVGSNVFLGRAVGIPPEQAGWADWAIVTPIVALSLLLPSIGGWGTREAAYVALLGTLADPVDADTATAVSLLFQGLNLLMALVGGVLYLVRGGGDRRGGERDGGGDREVGVQRDGGGESGGDREVGGDFEVGGDRDGGGESGGDREVGGDFEVGGDRDGGGDRDNRGDRALDVAGAPNASDRGRRIPLALGLIFVLALALRWWGIGFGLPHTYHPDEHQYVDSAVRMVGGDLDPERFNNPSGLKYLNTAVFALWANAASLAGGAPGGAERFQAAFALDPTPAYLVARALVGLIGALTIFVVYGLGRRLGGARAGLVAAALLAGAFLHARDSHYAVSDVPAALLVALVLAQAVRVLDGAGGPRPRTARAGGLDRLSRRRPTSHSGTGSGPEPDLDPDRRPDPRTALNPASAARLRTVVGHPLLAGALLTGLAAGTKYSALAVIVPLLLAHALAGTAAARADGALSRRDLATAARRMVEPRPLLAALAVPIAAAAAFLAVVPYAILNRPAFDEDIATLAARGAGGFKGLMIDPAPGWIFYLESLAWGLGAPLLVAAIAGLAIAIGSRRPAGLVIAAFPLLLWGYLGGELLMFARFMLPAVPPLCALAGLAVERAARRIEARRPAGRTGDAAAAVLTAALLAWPVASTIRHDLLLTRQDTRTLATRWIEANVPAGTPVLLQSAGPDLQPDDGEPVPGTSVPYRLEKVGTLDLPDRTLDEWRADGWEILVTSSHASERRLLDPALDQAHRQYYAAVEAELPVLAEFAPQAAGRPAIPFVYAQIYGPATDLWRIERPGPIVRVHRLSEGDRSTRP